MFLRRPSKSAFSNGGHVLGPPKKGPRQGSRKGRVKQKKRVEKGQKSVARREMGTVWRTARQTRRPSPPCAKSRHRVVTMSWPLLRQSFRDWREARTPCQIVGLARRKRPVKTDEKIKVVLLLICCWSVHRRRVVAPISLFQAAKAASAKRRRANKAISSMGPWGHEHSVG